VARTRFPDVADKLDDAGEDLLAFAAFPSPHWTKP
jgi:transposase-like protein